MLINGTRRGLVSVSEGQGVPLELCIADQTVEVWLDHSGIHFRPVGNGIARGHLPWEAAIAIALLPRELQRQLPPAARSTAA